jgi:hypothetical protein
MYFFFYVYKKGFVYLVKVQEGDEMKCAENTMLQIKYASSIICSHFKGKDKLSSTKKHNDKRRKENIQTLIRRCMNKRR